MYRIIRVSGRSTERDAERSRAVIASGFFHAADARECAVRWLKRYCDERDLIYLDYFSAMVDDKGFLKKELATDGLHPNAAGYKIMAPLAEAAITTALAAKQ